MENDAEKRIKQLVKKLVFVALNCIYVYECVVFLVCACIRFHLCYCSMCISKGEYPFQRGMNTSGCSNMRYLSVYSSNGKVTLKPGQTWHFDILLFHTTAGKLENRDILCGHKSTLVHTAQSSSSHISRIIII